MIGPHLSVTQPKIRNPTIHSVSDDESDDESASDELAAVAWQCDKDGMDEKVAGCMDSMDERVSVLEQAVLSGEGESWHYYEEKGLRGIARVAVFGSDCIVGDLDMRSVISE